MTALPWQALPSFKAGTVLGATLVLLVIAAVGGDRVHAQDAPSAFRGLFRAADPALTSTHRIDFVAAVFAGLADGDFEVGDSEELPLIAGSYVGVSPVLSYIYAGDRVSFDATAGGSFMNYSTIPGFHATRYFGRLHVGGKIGEQTTLNVRGGVSYSPYYAFSLAVSPEAEDFGLDLGDQEPFVAVRENLRADAHVELTHRMSERSQIVTRYDIARTTFFGDGFGQASHRAGVNYGRALSPNARLQLGYAFNYWNYPGADDAAAFLGHDIRAGVAYNRPLPGSPRTRFGFDFGSAVAQQPGTLRFDVTGTAYLAHQVSRRMFLVGSYYRGFDVRPGFVEPLYFFSDTVAVSGTIVMGRRAVASLVGSYVNGTFSADTYGQKARSWNGSGSVSYGFNALMSTYVQGTLTNQRLSEELGPLTGLPTLIDRYTLTGGFTIWLPWAK